MSEKAIIIIMLLGLGLLVGAYLLHSHASMPSWLGGTKLVAEYSENGTVVLSQALNPSPGSTWRLEQTPSGLMFKQLDSKLVEELKLTNITLAGGDVVAPSIYVWYFDGVDDYVRYGDNPFGATGDALTVVAAFQLSRASASFASDVIGDGVLEWWCYEYDGDYYLLHPRVTNATSPPWEWKVVHDTWVPVNEYHEVAQIIYKDTTYWGFEEIVDGNITSGTTNLDVNTYPYAIMPWTSLAAGSQVLVQVPGNYDTGMRGKLGYIFVGAYKEDPNNLVKHIISKLGTSVLLDASFYNGTHYIDLINGIAGTPHGGVQRIPSEHPFLWLVKSLASNGKTHFRFFPANTVIKIKDRVTGQEWTFTVTGVQNAAGLVEDFAVEPPTSNPVDIVAYIPSERVRFYAPEGFIVRLSDPNTGITTENKVTDGKVTLAGGTTVQLIAPNGEKNLVLNVDETPAVYRIIVKRPDGTPANAYVWVRDAAGNLLAYGVAEDGVYELPKKPSIPSAIRVEAQELDGGTWYHASRDFQLVENTNEPMTVTPQPQGLSSILGHSNVIWGLAVAFIFALLAAAIIAIVRG